MKYAFLISILLFSFKQVSSQIETRHGINTYISVGLNEDEFVTQQFEFGYQRHLSKGLYIIGSFMTANGKKSLKSILGQDPTFSNERINDQLWVSSDDIDDIYGKLYQLKSLHLGLKKNIQTGDKIFIAGGLGATYNRITQTDISGFIIDDNGAFDLENLFPKYGQYQNVGAKVSLEAILKYNQNLGFNIKAEYLSNSSLIHIGMGATIFISKKNN